MNIDPILIIYSALGAACLTLAVVHGMAWLRLRDQIGNGAIAITAAGTAIFCVTDLMMLKASTIEMYGWGLRWLHVPAFFIIVGLILFIRLHLKTGRTWLAWTVILVRGLSLAINFVVDFNLNYRSITSISQQSFLGMTFSDVEGTSHAWMLIGQFSLLLLIVFIIDALIAIRRRPDARNQRVLLASIAFFAIASTINAILVLWELSPIPLMPSVFFTGTVFVMAYNLSTSLTKSVLSARALQESNERMTLATEAVGLGIWRWDIAGNRVWGTKRWLELFGFDENAQPGYEDVNARIHPEDRADIERKVRDAIEQGLPLQGEFRVELPGGRTRWISARGRTVRHEDGRTDRFLGVAIDISDRKAMEADALQQRDELARLSRAATLGELSGSLAHELNQPLTAIMANTHAAQRHLEHDRPDLHEVRQILEDIAAEDERAAEIIRRLRMLLQQGEVRKARIDLHATIEDAARLFRSELGSQGVRLTLRLQPGMPEVCADRIQVQQVILNLVVNAAAAMTSTPEADRVVEIEAACHDDGWAVVTVADRGTGIAPDVLDRIFDPFVTTKPEGMGLGLKVCRTIVNAHGGTIEARNNQGPGATFRFTLPLADGPDQAC